MWAGVYDERRGRTEEVGWVESVRKYDEKIEDCVWYKCSHQKGRESGVVACVIREFLEYSPGKEECSGSWTGEGRYRAEVWGIRGDHDATPIAYWYPVNWFAAAETNGEAILGLPRWVMFEF